MIDGYVWLDDETTTGLGAHLYEALDQDIAVIGVAKSQYRQSDVAVEIQRGDSGRSLFVTAAGIRPEEAADAIRSMHGDFESRRC